MSFNENIYPILFESIQEGLIIVNSEGIIVKSNSVCERLFGFTSDELLGEKIEVLVPFKQRSNHVDLRTNYGKAPKQRSMGNNMRLNGQRKDGTVFPVEVSLNPYVDKGQRYVVALVSDVTLRRKTEDELLDLTQNLEQKVVERTKELGQSEQLYKSIARNFPEGVISIFDRNLRYLFAEGQGLYELGIETDDLIGLAYLDRIAPEAKEKVKSELELVFQGRSRSFEIEVGDWTYAINAVPLYDDMNKVDRILVVEKNISALKEASKRLEENLQQERHLNEMKSRFVSMASHEFRTPLTTINSSAGLILNYHLKQKYEPIPKHVERIKTSVRNLTTILNDFLSLEKLETGKTSCEAKSFDLITLITEVIDEMGGMVKGNQTLVYNGPDVLKVLLDFNLVKNSLINLVSNAIKYSPENKPIKVTVETVNDQVEIAVKDEGIGIPTEDQPKMFDRFFRAGNALNIEGTGLGLNIVVRYLELMNGKLRFESEEGLGTTFYLNLPQKFIHE